MATSGNLTDKGLELVLTNSPSRLQLANFFATGDLWRRELALYFRFVLPDDERKQQLLKQECGIEHHHNTLALRSITCLRALGSSHMEIDATVNLMMAGMMMWYPSENCGCLVSSAFMSDKLLQVRIFQGMNGQEGMIILDHKIYKD